MVDDGVGLMSGSGGSGERGHGLRNMRSRAEKLGGTFEVTVPEGGGTRLVWRVPC